MNDLQHKMVDLVDKKENLKAQLKEVSEQLDQVMIELGVGNFFQDETGVVLKVVVPEGQYTPFKKIDYVRTKRDGEARGSLSKKEADELMASLSK